MPWFWKKKPGEDRPTKVQIAEGLWVKCDSCKEIVYRAEVDRAGRACPGSSRWGWRPPTRCG